MAVDTTPATPVDRSPMNSALWCGFYGSGIIGCLVIYGLLQERIMSMPYGEPPLKFQDSVFLVFLNRAVAVIFAVIMVVTKGEDYKNHAPLWKYLAISFSSVYASTCQYEALKYVSFPVQMLGKSFKMMPVMLWGMVVSGKSYGLYDWTIAAAVTGGVTEFLLSGPISSHGDDGSSTYGLLLLGGFLFLDGFTSTFQEKLFKEHVTSKYNQMLYINLGSCVISSFTLLISGRMSTAFGFMLAHPGFAQDSLTLSAAAVTGQWFIYSQVKEFGALVFAATMNVRQICSIMLSYAKYGHTITGAQVIGLFMVFAALFHKSFSGFLAGPSSGEKKSLLTTKGEIAEPTGTKNV